MEQFLNISLLGLALCLVTFVDAALTTITADVESAIVNIKLTPTTASLTSASFAVSFLASPPRLLTSPALHSHTPSLAVDHL
jgi:hypothetical protein